MPCSKGVHTVSRGVHVQGLKPVFAFHQNTDGAVIMLPQDRAARGPLPVHGGWRRSALTPTLSSAGSMAGSGRRSPAEMLLRFLPSRFLPLRKKRGCLLTPVPARVAKEQ